MTEPIDDRNAGGEWAAPEPVDDRRPVEVRPADGPLPGSPVALGGSPAAFGSPAPGSPGPGSPGPGSPAASGSVAAPGSAGVPGSPAALPGSPVSPGGPAPDTLPIRITLPPELRPARPTVGGGATSPNAPAWGAPGGQPAASPAWTSPDWSGPQGRPNGQGWANQQGGHPLASPNWSPAGAPANHGWPASGVSTGTAPAGVLPRTPSGLFPSGPPRPTYREPHPVRGSMVAFGVGAGALWMLLFGLVASTARGYAWWTISAGITAWLAAAVLARFGDRGVAVGVAASTALGVAIAGAVVFARFIGGHWLLW
jgi:hypothetical protein